MHMVIYKKPEVEELNKSFNKKSAVEEIGREVELAFILCHSIYKCKSLSHQTVRFTVRSDITVRSQTGIPQKQGLVKYCEIE